MLEFTDIQSSVFQYASFRNAKGGILGSVPKSVSGKNPLKFVNFKCHCKFNVLFLIVL